MRSFLRDILRKLVGFDELVPADQLYFNTLKAMQAKASEHEEALASLDSRLRRLESVKRDRAGAPIIITDWETIQAHHAADPDNFKEVN